MLGIDLPLVWAFIIAFALQGAVWARELILGLLGRKIAGAQDGGTLANATALIRILVNVTLFAVAPSWVWNVGSVTATNRETNFGVQMVLSWFMMSRPSLK